jgi:hypothetical protein
MSTATIEIVMDDKTGSVKIAVSGSGGAEKVATIVLEKLSLEQDGFTHRTGITRDQWERSKSC